MYTISGMWYETKGKGETIVFLHGLPLDHRVFDEVVDDLSQFYKCVSVDLPGFGKSKKLLKKRISLEEYSLLVKNLLEEIGFSKYHLLAHSMGGYVALCMIGSLDAKSLILVSTKTEPDDPEKIKGRLAWADLIHKGYFNEYISQQISSCRLSDASNEKLLKTIMVDNVDQNTSVILEMLAKRKDLSDRLPEIKIPVLVVSGEYDYMHKDSVMMHDRLPNSRLEVLKNAGHMVFIDRKDEFVTIIKDFLRSNKYE